MKKILILTTFLIGSSAFADSHCIKTSTPLEVKVGKHSNFEQSLGASTWEEAADGTITTNSINLQFVVEKLMRAAVGKSEEKRAVKLNVVEERCN